jgi:hypothetical protein
MRHVHVVCDSQPNNPPIHAKHGNKQSGFRFAFASTFALLSLAFAPSATLLIFSSVFRLSKVPPHCCSNQLGPLVRQGADHVLNVRARIPTHPQLAGKGTVPLPEFATYKSGPCLLLALLEHWGLGSRKAPLRPIRHLLRKAIPTLMLLQRACDIKPHFELLAP